MKKRIWATGLALMLATGIFAGCGASDGDITAGETGKAPDGLNTQAPAVSQSQAPQEKEKLTVLYYAGHALGSYAQGYKYKNRDLDVEVQTYDLQGGPPALVRYAEDISNQLMTGNAPDVIAMTHKMALDFGSSAYIADLYEFMDADEEFNRDDYYMSVLDAYGQQGKLPVIPAQFERLYMGIRPEFAELSTPKLSEMDSIDVSRMFELFLSVDPDARLGMKPESMVLPFNMLRYSSYLDVNLGTANLNNEDFIALLENAREYANPKEWFNPYDRGYYHYDSTEDMYASFMFTQFSTRNLPHFLPATQAYLNIAAPTSPGQGPTDAFTHIRPFTAQDGRQMVYSDSLVAINIHSPNVEAAWDFVKYCLGGESAKGRIETFSTEVPNKAVNETIMEDYITEFLSAAAIDTSDEEVKRDIEDTLSMLLSNAEEPKFAVYWDSIADAQRVLEDFLVSGQPAYDTAVDLQRRVETYYIERQ